MAPAGLRRRLPSPNGAGLGLMGCWIIGLVECMDRSVTVVARGQSNQHSPVTYSVLAKHVASIRPWYIVLQITVFGGAVRGLGLTGYMPKDNSIDTLTILHD
jgi:hypothetical protein